MNAVFNHLLGLAIRSCRGRDRVWCSGFALFSSICEGIGQLRIRGVDGGGVVVRGNQMGVHAQALLAEVVQRISEISIGEIHWVGEFSRVSE